MYNPFEKRATEYLRDDESFLPAVSPEPLTVYLEEDANQDLLFDRLVMVVGTPGSGKTFLARLLQFKTISTLLKHRDIQSQKTLESALAKCRILKNGKPIIIGCRIPLESEYRDYWEFPYDDNLKAGLFQSMLQARTVLSWMHNITEAEYSLENIKILPRAVSEAAVNSIGGVEGENVFKRAREIEQAIYDVSAALIVPDAKDIPIEAISAYRPFDVIEKIIVNTGTEKFGTLQLQPLVMFDDAHALHADQFSQLEGWLVRRELKIARWIMTRLDAISPEKVLQGVTKNTHFSSNLKMVQTDRDITEIRFQHDENRGNNRKNFRKMAKDMSSRYLRIMPIFNKRRIDSLGQILSTEPEPISQSNLSELRKKVNETQLKFGVSDKRVTKHKELIEQYKKSSKRDDLSEDVRLAMESILIHRYMKRIHQNDMFQNDSDPEPNKEIKVDSGVVNGAKIHLLHQYQRPYYFGNDMLCDCGSENAELFLQLAAKLVAQSETKITRNQSPSLTSKVQHKLLQERAREIIEAWSFPEFESTKLIVNYIAEASLQETLMPNAWLDSGANAYGILQEEFEKIPKEAPYLAKVLQYAVAYNAINLVREHKTKGREWCLLELGGPGILHHGLTLMRGGFVEGSLKELLKVLEDKEQ